MPTALTGGQLDHRRPSPTGAESTLGGLFQYRISEHTFAVDGNGRPWFVYTDANYGAEPDHYGTFLTTLRRRLHRPRELDRHQRRGAARRALHHRILGIRSRLPCTPDGRLRLLAKVVGPRRGGQRDRERPGALLLRVRRRLRRSVPTGAATRILDTGYGSYPNPGWDLEVLPNGRPRAVLFAGSGDGSIEPRQHADLYGATPIAAATAGTDTRSPPRATAKRPTSR